jgi:hypothetical protein
LAVTKRQIEADNELFAKTMGLSNGFKSHLENTPKLVPSKRIAGESRSTTSKRSRARSTVNDLDYQEVRSKNGSYMD